MQTDLPPSSVNPVATNKKGKGCLIAAIGCGALFFLGFFFIVVVGALVEYQERSSSNTGANQNTANTVSQETVSTKSVALPSFTEALRAIYPEGEYTPSFPLMPQEFPAGRARWKNDELHLFVPLIDGEIDNNTPESDRFAENLVTAHSLLPFDQDGTKKLFVIFGAVPVNDSETEPTLGVAVLFLEGDRWSLETKSDMLSTIGTFANKIAEGKLVLIGGNRYGFVIPSVWRGEGPAQHFIRIVGQGPEMDIWNFGDITTGSEFDGDGLDDAIVYKYESRWEFLKDRALVASDDDDVGPREGYYPLQITRTGTCEGLNGGVANVNHSVIYQMYAEGYAAVGLDPLTENCATE